VYPFTYTVAPDEASAYRLAVAGRSAMFVAGGTTLIDLMKLNVERPSQLVDINRLPLSQIEELPGGGIRIGAMVRNSDMAQHDLVRMRYPVLSQALLAGASPQLRNMATTGGNILQRTRCWYFRDTASPCNKREPGTGCPAVQGQNRIHAVLGTSDRCIATHPSDMCVALAMLDATVRVHGPAGDRVIPFGMFHRVPGEHPERDTVLELGELITGVDIPRMPFATRSVYVKVRDRRSYAFALASAAVALDVRDDKIWEARIALGGVATKPWRSPEAESALMGKPAGTAAFQAAADAALHGAVPHAHNTFKIELAKRTLMRALARAAALT
jgi:xanthine dehydrogenase YagS FAD-binding subunit